MPILENPRHELFAQELAKGNSSSEAYVLAGYKPSRKNAARLRANEGVKARLAELQAVSARSTAITIESICAELDQANQVAMSRGQTAAMVSASTLRAKLGGLMIERVEVGGPDAFDEAETIEDVIEATCSSGYRLIMQPLSGLLVLDFTTLLPGPLASLMLAEAGAEVLKIERPGGEDTRRFPPSYDGESAPFAMLNRGKKSLTLDLKSEADREKLIPLIKRADILMEQFRPGVMSRLGFGYEDVRSINPRLIYCSISGYGQSGPRVDEAGHDINYIGNTGLLDLQPGPLDAPVVPPMLAADIAGGSFPAVINILLALRARDQSGQGCRLDIAMTDAMFTFGWAALALGAATGKFPKPGEHWLVGGSPRYQIYPAKDGKLVACGALEQKFWAAFTKAIGLPAEFVNDLRDPKTTREAVAKLIAARTSDEWRPIFAVADCCTTIVVPLEQAIRDPHFVERGLFDHKVETASGKTIPALPLPIAPEFRDKPGAKKAPKLEKN
jgi:alpha-methylacyl-CoA racemase